MRYLEPPIANTGRLAENCAVWTEEAELAPIWQTPMPDLIKNFKIAFILLCFDQTARVNGVNLPDI